MAIMATPLRAKYNPNAYVPGGSSPAVAKAIQAQGYRSAYKPGLPTPPPAAPAPPSTQSSQVAAVNAGAPAVSAGAAMPGEGVYAQDSAGAYDAYNAAMAAAEKDQQAARAQYGFNAQGTNLDPNSQTGIFQRLMHQQAQTSMNDSEAALASGLGGTGLGAQRAEAGNFQNQADLADTTQGYQALLAQALARKGDASTTLTNALLAARQRQLEQDMQQQMFQQWSDMMAGLSGGGGDQGGYVPAPADPTQAYYNPKTKQTVNSRPIVRAGQAWMT